MFRNNIQFNNGSSSAEAALENEQKDEKKGPHHSMKQFIYKQDVSLLKACSIICFCNPFSFLAVASGQIFNKGRSNSEAALQNKQKDEKKPDK